MISGQDCICEEDRDNDIYVILNQWIEPLIFELPDPPSGARWYRVVDTYEESPYDFLDDPVPVGRFYRVMPRSSVVLIGK